MASSPASCPLCGGESRFAAAKDGYEIFRCAACDFLFVHPYPTPEEIAAFYSANYRGASAGFYPKLKSRKRRAFVKSLRFLRYVRGRRTLDIGCGGGIMADAFRRLGADSHGLDISENSIAFARNAFPKCTFYCEDFETMARRGLKFDFMFTSELMEHLAGPHPCMRLIAAAAEPGTIVYVAAPDSGHEEVPAELTEWVDLCPPEHLQWMNRENMALLFREYGFDLVKAFPKKSAALSLLFRKTA